MNQTSNLPSGPPPSAATPTAANCAPQTPGRSVTLRAGSPPPRPRRPDLHRPARPLRPDAGRLRPARHRPRRTRSPPTCAASTCCQVTARCAPRPEGTVNPKLRDRRDRGRRARAPTILNAAKTPPFLHQRDDVDVDEYAPADATATSTCAAPACSANLMLRHSDRQGHPRLPRRARLPRDRDADPGQEHARGRARLPRAQPRPPRRSSTPCRSRRSSSSSC